MENAMTSIEESVSHDIECHIKNVAKHESKKSDDI